MTGEELDRVIELIRVAIVTSLPTLSAAAMQLLSALGEISGNLTEVSTRLEWTVEQLAELNKQVRIIEIDLHHMDTMTRRTV